jgi:hypothetical protein
MKELDSFIDEPNVPEDGKFFHCWTENKSKYPTVALVARAYFII